MWKGTFLRLSLMALIMLAGCQSAGPMINVHIKAIELPSEQMRGAAKNLRILVESFEDARTNKEVLGTWIHSWGRETSFNAWNGEIGQGIAQVAVEYLQQKGWQASLGQSRATSSRNNPDVTLSGKILDLQIQAQSGSLSTQIDVTAKVEFHLKNLVDASTLQLAHGASGTKTVLSFEPEDAEELVNRVLARTFAQLLEGTHVEGRALRLTLSKG